MWRTIAAVTTHLACLMMLVPLAPPASAAQPRFADPAPVVPAVTVTAERAMPIAVSKNGRYVVQYVNGRLELRDRKKDRRIKRFPGVASRFTVSISDSGRYVAYTVPYKGRYWVGESWNNWRREVRVYDRRTGKTRSATTTKSGKSLKPTWESTCVGDTDDLPADGSGVVCDEGVPITASPQLDGGQISGNGRYIAFCANYIKPDRIDLYIKNWRTKSLKRINGACRFVYDIDAGGQTILPPMISEDGGVVLLPGHWRHAEDGDGCWEPTRALIGRRTVVEVGGRRPTMTHDGRIISTVGPATGCDDHTEAAYAVSWFDLTTRAIRPADEPGLRLTMRNASRHGRYVTWFTYGDLLFDPQTGTYPGQRWLIWDRATGTRFDLSSALRGAGYEPRLGGAWFGHYPSVDYPVMTGDGRTVFLDTDRGPVAVRWSPSA